MRERSAARLWNSLGVLRLRTAFAARSRYFAQDDNLHNNSLQSVNSYILQIVNPVSPCTSDHYLPGSAVRFFTPLRQHGLQYEKHPPAAVRHPIAMLRGGRRFSMKSIYCTLILLLVDPCRFRGANSGCGFQTSPRVRAPQARQGGGVLPLHPGPYVRGAGGGVRPQRAGQ